MLTLKNAFKSVFFLILLMYAPLNLYSHNYSQHSDYESPQTEANEIIEKACCGSGNGHTKSRTQTYYLLTADFINSFIQIPTTTIAEDSSTIASSYLAGRAPLYNTKNKLVGTCSASFLNMQNAEGIFTDISNYISVDNGLIITWFTPTTLINLALDSLVHSMVTECLVTATTKIGFNPFYGKKFNMIVSSKKDRIYFKLTEI